MRKRPKWDEGFGILFLAAASVMLIISLRLSFANGIWYDELFTMGLTDRSFAELTAFTARDVHPPFYYYYVKIIQELCQVAAPGINTIIVGKICSVLPLLGMLAYALTKVRKHFGMLCAGLFIFCIISMPALPQYTVEIRMYTLAMFLVTAAFLHAYEIVCGKFKASADWICLAIYGILAAYTHYFACVAVGMIYLYLLVASITERKKGMTPGLRNWGMCAVISVIAYIPWMSAVIAQVTQVKENYWILPLTWRTFGSCVKFLMKPQFGSSTFQVIIAVVLFLVYVGFMLYFLWKNREQREESMFVLAGTGVLAGLVLFGFAASFLLRPVFIVRYMLPAVGCFWLSFSVVISRLKGKQWMVLPVIGLILIVGIGNFRWFRNDETWRRVRMEEVESAFAEIAPEDMVIAGFNHVQGVAGYYLDNDVYLWNTQPEELICNIIEDKYYPLYSAEDMRKALADGRNVWFIGDKQADVLKEWEQAGIRAEEKQEVMLEVYWMTLYRLYTTD